MPLFGPIYSYLPKGLLKGKLSGGLLKGIGRDGGYLYIGLIKGTGLKIG